MVRTDDAQDGEEESVFVIEDSNPEEEVELQMFYQPKPDG